MSGLLKDAPRYITKQYSGIHMYVWKKLYSESRYRALTRKKSEAQYKERLKNMKILANEATTVVLIFLINRMLRKGTEIAKDTINNLKCFDIDSFSLGTLTYEGNNKNVTLGEDLANELIETIPDKKLKKFILSCTSVAEIIRYYRAIKL